MVTRARLECATPSFGGWCSIQLSYRATQAVAFDGLWLRKAFASPHPAERYPSENRWGCGFASPLFVDFIAAAVKKSQR